MPSKSRIRRWINRHFFYLIVMYPTICFLFRINERVLDFSLYGRAMWHQQKVMFMQPFMNTAVKSLIRRMLHRLSVLSDNQVFSLLDVTFCVQDDYSGGMCFAVLVFCLLALCNLSADCEPIDVVLS